MTNSLIINENVLKQFKIEGIELIFLTFLYTKTNLGVGDITKINLKKLENRKLIKIIDNKPYLRQEGKDLIRFCLVDINMQYDSKKKIVAVSDKVLDEKIEGFVDDFRKKWRGLKPGAMGSKEGVSQKLKRWIQNNPNIDLETISKAADNYINGADGTDPRFLQRADYFIYKQDSNKDLSSRLSAYVDEIIMGVEEDNKDWTTKIN